MFFYLSIIIIIIYYLINEKNNPNPQFIMGFGPENSKSAQPDLIVGWNPNSINFCCVFLIFLSILYYFLRFYCFFTSSYYFSIYSSYLFYFLKKL